MFNMKTKMLAPLAALFGLLACTQNAMKPEQGYIGPSDIQVQDGRMTPEVLAY